MNTSIYGSNSSDTLQGTGSSNLYGGAGNDTYHIQSTSDQAIEVEKVFYGGAGAITRLSINNRREEAQGDSFILNASTNGLFVLVASTAGNLSSGDTNRGYDVFVKNTQLNTFSLTNRTISQLISNGYSSNGQISADAKQAVFISDASNLVTNDTNGMPDVFVKDLYTHNVVRLGQPLTGQVDGYVQNVSFSPDGQWILYQTDSNRLVAGDSNSGSDIFMQSVQTGVIKRVSQTLAGIGGNGDSTDARFSTDGRYIILHSYANNLTNDDILGGTRTIYRYDTQTGVIDAPIHSIDGEPINSDCMYGRLSPDGTKLVFASTATNLTANFSEDDRFFSNLFVADLITGQVQQINLTENGQATYADGFSWSAHFTPDSQSVIFSGWDNLVDADTNLNADIYIRHLMTGELTLLSTNAQGQAGNQNSWGEYLSADGHTLFFNSNATNLVANDTNGATDVFAKIISAMVDAGGIDTVISQVNYQLGAGLEHLTLTANAIEGTGNQLANTLIGNTLNNTLSGLTGNDRLEGGEGSDTLWGGHDQDLLFGNAGTDVLYGEVGDDRLYGANGLDQLWGGFGEDLLYGGGDADLLDGGDADDILDGGSGNDQLYGGRDIDQLYGELGNDVLDGGSQNDQLYGGAGNDQLLGGTGSDRLYGSSGQDTLIGHSGNDRLEGGLDADLYIVGRLQGQDRILDQDSNTTAIDVMQFGQNVSYQQLWFSSKGEDLIIKVLGGTDQVLVEKWFVSSHYRVERIEAANNISLAGIEVAQLVNAMAALAPPTSSQTTLNSQQLAALNGTFAVTWLD